MKIGQYLPELSQN